MKVGQSSNPNEAFYFTESIKKMIFSTKNENIFYAIDMNNFLSMIDLSNGKLVKQVECKAGWKTIEIDRSSNLILVYKDKLTIFNSDLKQMKRLKLINFPEKVNMKLYFENDRLYCFETKTYKLASFYILS